MLDVFIVVLIAGAVAAGVWVAWYENKGEKK